MSQMLYTPKQTAEKLGIASSTLRLWASHFGPILSSHANPPKDADGKAGRRSFTDQDIRLLQWAQELLRDGLRFDQVLPIIQTEELPEPPEEPQPIPPEMALAIPDQFLNGLAELARVAVDQRARIDELERRISELEKSKAPWYRRLFGR